MAEAPRTKLLSKAVGTFRVLAATPDTVTMDEDGIRNTVSIDRVSLTPIPGSPERSERADLTNQQAVPEANDSESEAKKNANEAATHDEEYVVNRIVGHRHQKNGTRSRVRPYCYSKKEDTFKPGEHIPEHFVVRYWQPKNDGK